LTEKNSHFPLKANKKITANLERIHTVSSLGRPSLWAINQHHIPETQLHALKDDDEPPCMPKKSTTELCYKVCRQLYPRGYN